MKGFRRNILAPLALPVAATAVIVAVVFNFSRVLLVLEERNGPSVATIMAIVAAAGVLLGSAYFSSRRAARSSGLTVLAAAALVLAFAGGYGLGATGDGEAEEGELAATGEEAAGAPQGGTLDVVGTEFAFDPAEATLPAGPITVNLKNEGVVVHTFLFEGVPAFEELSAVAKGGTATGTVDLTPGTYVYYCSEPGHRGGGMEGTLTVTEGAAGAAAGAATGGDAAPTKVEVAGTEFAFEPAEVEAAGPVEITLKNEGVVVHTLLFDEVPGFDVLTAEKGASATGVLEAAPGTYTFYCNEPGHRGAGMEGTLVLTEGAGGAGPPAAAPAAPATPSKTEVAGKEFAFDPAEISVPAGPVEITLKNEGVVVHTLLIEGVDAFTPLKAEKGATASGVLQATPGTYTYYCDEAGHRGAGMEGTLTVT